MKTLSHFICHISLIICGSSCGYGYQTDLRPNQNTVSNHPQSALTHTRFENKLDITSFLSYPWLGTYFATLPCKRCEGIEMWITLKTDGNYLVKTHYLGLNDALEEEFSGKFFWDQNTNIIHLAALRGYYSEHYLISNDKLVYLDPNSKPFRGKMAEQYILQKKSIN